MLSTNINIMKSNLNKLLDDNGPVYNAAYDAFYNTINIDNVNIDDPDFAELVSSGNSKRKQQLEKDAKKFAKNFCDGLKSGGLMNSIADEIDKHIKQAMITINVPAIPPTLISPIGPVTGSLIISEATGAKITIS